MTIFDIDEVTPPSYPSPLKGEGNKKAKRE
jgi:hypothetical protein